MSELCKIPHVRVAKKFVDLETDDGEMEVTAQLEVCAKPNLWAALLRTGGSPWQRLDLYMLGNKFMKKLAASK